MRMEYEESDLEDIWIKKNINIKNQQDLMTDLIKGGWEEWVKWHF